ncbi:MAG TPA: mechanosensitive ion channel domain-containing protein [Sphingomicrobium sp.]|jgi:small-conductance mechanosensitive channel
MVFGGDAGRAIDDGREGVESIVNWFAANWNDLPVGLAVAAAIVLVMLAARWGGSQLMAGDPECHRWRGVIGRVLHKTSIFFMVAAALDIVATYAAVPARIERLLDILFTIAFALQGAIWARELIIGVITRKAGEDPTETSIGNALAVIRVLVSVTLFALAIIVILDNLGVNVTALVAGLGIGGIAIGLAAQGIFSDLFAALSILFDKPFRRGDVIQFDQTTGTIERIGLKTTRLRSINGEQVVMANTKLLEREVRNYAGGRTRRSLLPFGLVYQTAPEQLEKVMSLVKAAVESRKGCTFVRCAILGFGASSIDFELIFDSRTSDMNKVAADRTAVVLAILRTFAEHGLEFAYPTQTTFTAAPDGTMIMPYAAPSR